MPFDDVQIPQLGVGRRHVDGGIQIASLVLHKALIGDAVVITAIKIIRRYAHPELAGDNWPHQEDIGLVGVTVLALLLQEVVIFQHTRPFIEVVAFFGDDVDHAADGVRAIQ